MQQPASGEKKNPDTLESGKRVYAKFRLNLKKKNRKKMGKGTIRWIRPGGYSAMDSRKTAKISM